MTFAQVIGQESVKQLLRSFVQSGRIPHAQILLGETGAGSLALALAFVQYVMCENSTTTDACGVCNSCNKVSKNIHPDVHFSYPTVGSKAVSSQYLSEWRSALAQNPYMGIQQWLESLDAENKQGNITVDECQQIIKKLSLKIFEGRYKILLMWLPEYLGKEGNRLLKLIEEPPDDTLFLLVAENQELILNTILSRCQLIKIPRLSDDTVAQALTEKQGIHSNNAHAAAHLANGSYGTAMILAANNENDNANLFLDWMRKCYQGNGVEIVQWVDKFAQIGREKQKYFMQYGLHFLREMLVFMMTNNTNVRLRATELETAQRLSKVMHFESVKQIANILNENAYNIERNANPKILMLDASIKVNKIMKH